MYNCISKILGCLQVFSFFTVYYLLFQLVSAVSQLFCVEETLHLVLCVKQRFVLLKYGLLCWLWGRGGVMRYWGLGFFGGCFLYVYVFSFASPGTSNLFATIRKSQSLGNRFGAMVGGGERMELSLPNFSAGALRDGHP